MYSSTKFRCVLQKEALLLEPGLFYPCGFFFIFVNNLTGSPNILKPGIIWSSYHILKENPFHRAMEDFVLYKYVL